MPNIREFEKKLIERKYTEVSENIDGDVITFRLRRLTAKEWLDCTSAARHRESEAGIRMVAWSLVDENNDPIYANEEGVQIVSQFSPGIVLKLVDAVTTLSGLKTEDDKRSDFRKT